MRNLTPILSVNEDVTISGAPYRQRNKKATRGLFIAAANILNLK